MGIRVYKQLGDSNSQWKKNCKKCQLGKLPVEGLVVVWGQNLTFGGTIFFQLCRRSFRNTKFTKTVESDKIFCVLDARIFIT